MAALRSFEFRILKYVPNAMQDVAANVGVVLVEVEGSGSRFADVRLTQDWRHARLLDPSLDIELWTELEKEIRARLNSPAVDCSRGGTEVSQRDWMLYVLDDWFSNGIQVSQPRALLAEDPVAELSRLVKTCCEVPTAEGFARGENLSGRRYIKSRMAEEFRLAGVWNALIKDIPASQYTVKGDRLKIDFGYLANETTRGLGTAGKESGSMYLIHAVSLKTDPELAKVLAFSWPRLRDGIFRKEHRDAELTAVVESGLGDEDEAISFAMNTLKENGVDVRTLSQASEIAAESRRRLSF